MTTEQWRPIAEYEGSYEVSSTGLVKSLARTTTRVQGDKIITQPIKESLLTRTPSKSGHLTVKLCKDGISATKSVHDLVALTFIGPRPPLMQVCHEDGVESNNNVKNLRYDTPTGNAADRHLHGTDAKGVNNPGNKYPEDLIQKVKSDMNTKTNVQLSAEYGIPQSTISSIRTGKRWAFL